MKFNERAETKKTSNLNGWGAYELRGKELLAAQVLTSFVSEPKYYGDNTPEIVSTAEALAESDPDFVAKLAVWARTMANMRSTSHMLCAVLAHGEASRRLVASTVPRCVVRGDDVTEILSAYMSLYGKPIPRQLRMALRSALESLTPFEIAKYQARDKAVKMADAVKMLHPRPTSDEMSETFRACIERTLAVPESWEVALSRDGNSKETWERLISDGNLPYMAALRNLRNLIAANPDNMDAVLDRLSDGDAVRKSRQLPFRYYSAYRSVERKASSKVLDALETAIDASLDGYPRLGGRTVIAIDTSGSMSQPLSRRSAVSIADVAILMAVCIARLSDEAYVYTFSSEAKRWPVSSKGSLLSQTRGIASDGYETNMRSLFDALAADGVDCDRIVILSDMEVNSDCSLSFWHGDEDVYGKKAVQTHLGKYRERVGHDVWCFGWDMAGYGTTQFDGPKFAVLAGWSEKVIPLIAMVEAGTSSLVDEIEGIEL